MNRFIIFFISGIAIFLLVVFFILKPYIIGGPQFLPISAKFFESGQTIYLEVAQTSKQISTGLMYRTFLPDNNGMLFLFDYPRAANFWMINCKIPLDMIFMNGSTVVGIQYSAPPCIVEPCPIYGSDVLADRVIELRGGRAAQLDIDLGDSIDIDLNYSP